MGLIHSRRGAMHEAIACFKRAYDIEPHVGQRAFDLAAAYLRVGDFAAGLPLYERRNEILPRTGAVPDAPEWQGEKTGHLAVWPDQGYGDTLMFARFLPWAREFCDKITCMVSAPLLPLMSGYDSVATMATGVDLDAKYDHQIRLSSLPRLYGLNLANIPKDPGLLAAAATAGRLAGDGLKIGIAWQGNRAFPGDDMRSIPFRELVPLAADPRNTLFSLQCGPDAADIPRARAQRIVRDLSGDIEGEWSHTAAVIKSLDLVVTSCTAIAHLAGCLGVPTFVMVPNFAYWVWLSGRDDSPWYPSVKLFRQTKTGQWDDVVKRVCAAIEQMHRARAIAQLLQAGIPQPAAPMEYEPDVARVMERVLRKGDVVIDVGANVGVHTVLAAKLVNFTGQVIAIEPGPNNLPALEKAVEGMPQVEIVRQPVTNEAGLVTFWLNADNGGGNALWDPADWPESHNPKSKEHPQPVEMQATTLDAISAGMERAPRLIKIDVEGAEQLVLEGSSALLQRSDRPPFIIAELHEFGLQSLGCTQASLRAFMAHRGYSTFIIHADGSLPALVPPDTTIRTGLIVNLLFSTPQAVASCWGTVDPAADNRAFHADGIRNAA
jgi:FkbM family methyltransferase